MHSHHPPPTALLNTKTHKTQSHAYMWRRLIIRGPPNFSPDVFEPISTVVAFVQLACQKVKFIQQEFKEEFLQIFAQDPDREAEMPAR